MSDRAQRILLWAVAVLLVAGTALALQYVRGYQPLAGFGGPSRSPLPTDIALRFDRVRVVGRTGNQPAWTLTANQIDTTQNRSRVTFRGQIAATLLQDGKKRAALQAPSAVYDAIHKQLAVNGGVACTMSDPKAGSTLLRIHSPDLEWKVDSHLVEASGPVTATLPNGDTVQGNQLAVDLRNRNLSLKNVHATFYVEEGEAPAPNLLPGLNP